MTIDPAAFEYYRRSPNHKTTLPRLRLNGDRRLVLGGNNLAAAAGRHYFFVVWQASSGASAGRRAVQNFLASRAGIPHRACPVLGDCSACGAKRWVHREPLSALIGASRCVSRDGFLKGLAAVLITSPLSEILLYCLQPDIAAVRSACHPGCCS